MSLNAYITGDEDYFRLTRERWHPNWCDTRIHQVNYHFRQGTEHKYAYDFETLLRVLERLEFVWVARRPFAPVGLVELIIMRATMYRPLRPFATAILGVYRKPEAH